MYFKVYGVSYDLTPTAIAKAEDLEDAIAIFKNFVDKYDDAFIVKHDTDDFWDYKFITKSSDEYDDRLYLFDPNED